MKKHLTKHWWFYALLVLATWYHAVANEVIDIALQPGESIQLTDLDAPENHNRRRLRVDRLEDGFRVAAWWGDECIFEVGGFGLAGRDHRVFPIDSGFEWTFEADSGREWVFMWRTKNLSLLPQPDGSYAFYHATKRNNARNVDSAGNLLWVDAYQTGKLMHQLAPYGIDANGDRFEMCQWYGDDGFHLEVADGYNPAYPVWIDPQFPTPSIGATGPENLGRYIQVNTYTGFTGYTGSTVDSIVEYATPNSNVLRYAVYTDNSGPDDAIVFGDTAITTGTAGWYQGVPETGGAVELTASATYYIGWGEDNGNSYEVFYDVGSSGDSYYVALSGSLPDPMTGEAADTWIVSSYITYTNGTPPASLPGTYWSSGSWDTGGWDGD